MKKYGVKSLFFIFFLNIPEIKNKDLTPFFAPFFG